MFIIYKKCQKEKKNRRRIRYENIRITKCRSVRVYEIKKYKNKNKEKRNIKKNCAKDMLSEIKELKEIETKLEELEIKILRKRFKNESRGFKKLTEQEIELVKKAKNRR